MLPFFNNIGEYIKTVVDDFSNSATSSEVDGTATQIVGPGYAYKSAQVSLYLGAAAGSPSAVSVACQVEHAPASSGPWTAFTDLLGHGLITNIAASSQVSANVNLEGAQQFVRLAVTPTLTGGSSPSIPIIGVMVLGGTSEHPAV